MTAFHTIRGQHEDRKITDREALQQIESAILANEMSLTDRNEALAWAGCIVEGIANANPLTLDELREINDDADFYFAAAAAGISLHIPAVKLIDEKTGREIKPGDTVTTFRGEKATLVSFAAPRHSGSSGRVYIREEKGYEGDYYPSVIGAKIITA